MRPRKRPAGLRPGHLLGKEKYFLPLRRVLATAFSKFLKNLFARHLQTGFGKGPNFEISLVIETRFFEIDGVVDAHVAGGFDDADFFDEKVFAMLNEGGVGLESDGGLGGSVFEGDRNFDWRGVFVEDDGWMVGVASDQAEAEG
jgi:hypothetical protein